MKRIDSENSKSNKFVDENLPLGTQGTTITAKWLNGVQEEIVSVIEDAGLTPNDSNQLNQAIDKKIGNNIKKISDDIDSKIRNLTSSNSDLDFHLKNLELNLKGKIKDEDDKINAKIQELRTTLNRKITNDDENLKTELKLKADNSTITISNNTISVKAHQNGYISTDINNGGIFVNVDKIIKDKKIVDEIYLVNKILDKSDTTYVNSELSKKANITYVDAKISNTETQLKKDIENAKPKLNSNGYIKDVQGLLVDIDKIINDKSLVNTTALNTKISEQVSPVKTDLQALKTLMEEVKKKLHDLISLKHSALYDSANFKAIEVKNEEITATKPIFYTESVKINKPNQLIPLGFVKKTLVDGIDLAFNKYPDAKLRVVLSDFKTKINGMGV